MEGGSNEEPSYSQQSNRYKQKSSKKKLQSEPSSHTLNSGQVQRNGPNAMQIQNQDTSSMGQIQRIGGTQNSGADNYLAPLQEPQPMQAMQLQTENKALRLELEK